MRELSRFTHPVLRKTPGYFTIFLFMTVIFCSITTKSYCADYYTRLTLEVREEGRDYYVAFDVSYGEFVLYANDENCGNSAHRTANGGRYFEHIHFSYSLPKNGHDEFGNPRTVTIANTSEWWHYNYFRDPDYVQIMPADPHYNCWGYSLGYNVWIQDPSYIYIDDYNITSTYAVGNKETSSGHIIDITGINSSRISQTEEKFRNSAVYRRNYTPPRTVNSGFIMRVHK
jgi:hypothetical protein